MSIRNGTTRCRFICRAAHTKWQTCKCCIPPQQAAVLGLRSCALHHSLDDCAHQDRTEVSSLDIESPAAASKSQTRESSNVPFQLSTHGLDDTLEIACHLCKASSTRLCITLVLAPAFGEAYRGMQCKHSFLRFSSCRYPHHNPWKIPRNWMERIFASLRFMNHEDGFLDIQRSNNTNSSSHLFRVSNWHVKGHFSVKVREWWLRVAFKAREWWSLTWCHSEWSALFIFHHFRKWTYPRMWRFLLVFWQTIFDIPMNILYQETNRRKMIFSIPSYLAWCRRW